MGFSPECACEFEFGMFLPSVSQASLPLSPFRAVTGSSARFPKEKGEEIPRRHGSPLSREAAGWD